MNGFILVDEDWCVIYKSALKGILRHLLEDNHQEGARDKEEYFEESSSEQTLWEVWPTWVGTDVEKNLRHAMDKQVFSSMEYGYPNKSTKVICLEIQTHPFPGGLAIFFHDISDRHQPERQDQQAEIDLQKQNQELEQRIAQSTAQLSQVLAELHSTQATLNSRENHYAQALKFSQTGSWEFDVVTEKVFWSEEVERIWGMEPGTFRGELQQVQGAIHPEDVEHWQKNVQDCREKGKEHRIEYRIIHPDASIHWVQALGSAEKDDQGNVIRLLGIVMDITERKQLELEHKETEMALRESEALFRNMADHAPVMVWVTDETGYSTYVSQSWYDFSGQKEGTALGFGWLDVIHPDERELARKRFLEFNEKRQPFSIDYRFRRRDGVYCWGIDAGKPRFSADGQFKGYIGSVMDISDRKRMEEQLRIFECIVATTQDMMALIDQNYTYQIVNDAYARNFQRAKEEIIGKSVVEIVGEEFMDTIQPHLDRCLQGEEVRYETWFDLGEEQRYYHALYSRYREANKGVTSAVVNIHDITQIKESEQKLYYQAHHDTLTNLPNRMLMNTRLEQSIQQATRKGDKLAVVFIDLDRFKNINDSLGHRAGDSLLEQLAQRLCQQRRKSDTVARISGDEFVVILEDIKDTQHAGMVVGKLMRTFEEPFIIEGRTIKMTSSMGLSLFPDDGTDVATLLRNADAAMYRAKEDGRNTYCFYRKEMTSTVFEYMLLENALREALKKKEFYLLYQPQIEMLSHRCLGIEALLRWHHPELGVVSPAQFIPIAEQSGLIQEIGTWVLTTACRQAKIWLEQKLDFGRIAVNVAAPQIQHGDFIQVVENVLKTTGLPAAYLELELTEGLLMKQTEQNIKQLEKLQGMGIKLTIDDFGIGYSSLNYLKRLPIDKLKIDQSFIRDLPHDTNDTAISQAVIALGYALNLQIIAEGVENEEQAAFLKEKGCHQAQGYFFSQPIPPQQVSALFA